MKKVLLASTILAFSAGVAAADIALTGDASMGVKYDDRAADELQLHYEIDLNLALFSPEDQAKLLPPEEVNITQLNAEYNRLREQYQRTGNAQALKLLEQNYKTRYAATFQYYDLVTYENLRDFMIEYADRILFGTDIGRWDNAERGQRFAEQYWRAFRILETDETVPGGFFSQNEIRGLALPRDVLAKIYYQNAARLYPRVKHQLKELDYSLP